MEQQIENLTGLRVLLAEDETLVLMEIEDMLHELQCEIVGPVGTVETAVAAIRGQCFDGALLDINLHGRTILPAVEELLRQAVPFLLITGYPARDSDPPGLKDAPRLTKPFSLQGLKAALRDVFVPPARSGT